ncbi:MAG: hypothetical protein DRJ66_00625 [Thermoprotei archaeon]|nr:MAG: hypothetical protein DRJ66_00625 [Thermoprotei archaeon]RLF19439.1 MAG: hypothetical protein DRZ82_05710 [Thermoprotei archaeon]
MRERVLVLDASAIINYLAKFGNIDGEAYITERAIEEIESEDGRMRVQQLIEMGKLHIRKPDKNYVRKVIEAARRTGDLVELSAADIDTLALALELMNSNRNVLLITDDYSIMNVAYSLGIKFLSLFMKPIREYREYIYICRTCNFSTREPPKNFICPRCGDKLVRRIRKRFRI